MFITHDINPILRYVDRVLYLAPGDWAIGTPDDVLTSQTLSRLYNTEIDVLRVRGRVVGLDPVSGMLGGSLAVGAVLGVLSLRGRERDSAIGAVLAFGLGVGVLFLSLYQGYATQATNLLFGSIVGVSDRQLLELAIVAVIVLAGIAAAYRPLLFSSIDPEVAEARGVPLRAL